MTAGTMHPRQGRLPPAAALPALSAQVRCGKLPAQ